MNSPTGAASTARRAVVLGGTGLIGAYVVQELLDHGWHVAVIGRRFTEANRRRYTRQQLAVYRASLEETDALLRLSEGADAWIHLAHATVPGESMADPGRDITATLLPSVQLLAGLSRRGVRHIVYVSSGGTVYGRAESIPIPEDHPTRPLSAYGVAKLASEAYVRLYAELGGLSAAILRPSNAYGPDQDVTRQHGAVRVFLARVAARQPIQIWGDGSVVRDYVHAVDVARAVQMAAENQLSETWNVGAGIGHSLNDVITLVEQVVGRPAHVERVAARPFDVPSNVLDTTRIRAALGWRARVDLEAGIRQLYEWQRQRTSEAPWSVQWRVPA